MILCKFVDQHLSNYSKSNGSSSIKRSKFIGFFVNNRYGHFKQITIVLEKIQKVFNI